MHRAQPPQFVLPKNLPAPLRAVIVDRPSGPSGSRDRANGTRRVPATLPPIPRSELFPPVPEIPRTDLKMPGAGLEIPLRFQPGNCMFLGICSKIPEIPC